MSLAEVLARPSSPARADDAAPAITAEPLASALARRGAWTKLAARAAEPNVFAEPAMLSALADHLGMADIRLAWAQCGEGAAPVLALPFRVRRSPFTAGVAVAESLWSRYGPLGTPLVEAGAERQAAAAILALPARLGVAALVMPYQRLDGPVAGAIEAEAGRQGLGLIRRNTAFRAALDTRRGEAALGDAGTAKRRKEHGRLLRRLGDRGFVTFTASSDPEAIPGLLDEFLALERTGWKGRQGTALADRPASLALARALVGALGAEGRVRIDALRLDGRPVAMLLTLLAGPAAATWKTAYDEAYAAFSPGLLLMAQLTRSLLAEGRLGHVDSLAVPGHPMIEKVWSGRMEVGTLVIPAQGREAAARRALAAMDLTLAGRALAARAVRGAKRALRR